MAHNLSFVNNQAGDFVYTNEKPWHGFGTFKEKVSREDAMILGGMGYTVEKLPNIHKIGSLEFVSETSFFTYRTDNNIILGSHVGSRYTCVQNDIALGIVDQFPFHIETAGVLKDGAISFICMKSDRQIVVGGTDVTDMYLLFTNSFDGSMPISVTFTPIRVVCNNTLSAALRTTKNKYTFRHTASVNSKINEFAKVMGLLEKNQVNLEGAYNQMAETKVNMVDFVGHVLLTKEEITALALGATMDETVLSTRKKNIILNTLIYAEQGPGQQEWMNTGWGGYNAVTGYMGSKEFDGGEDAMLSTVLNLNYQNTAQVAFDLALAGKLTPIKGLEKELFN